jgi:hypothetical protein
MTRHETGALGAVAATPGAGEGPSRDERENPSDSTGSQQAQRYVGAAHGPILYQKRRPLRFCLPRVWGRIGSRRGGVSS